MSRVVMEHVSKIFPRPDGGSVRALDDFSLSVSEQECLVLVGPSGSGKTTALRVIAGLEAVTSGAITLDGVPANHLPEKHRRVAMVFQHHALYPHQTVFENLAFGLKLRKVPKAERERRVKETARMLGLMPVLQTLPENLSGGERQRVALGRALIRKPHVLLCDEPLSQLDAPLRAQLRMELMRVRKELALTMIYVTHDQAEAMTLGDRVAVMNAGSILQVDSPEQVFREPASLFVAGFIGLPPMNLFHGRLLGLEAQLVFAETNSGGEAGFSAPVDRKHRKQLGERAGQPIVLGVRPEHVGPDTTSSPNMAVIEGWVRLVELAGAGIWWYCETKSHRFAGRGSDCSKAHIGQSVRLRLDMSQARYFDPVTQQAIC